MLCSLSLLPNTTLSPSLASVVCSYIKRKITLAIFEKRKKWGTGNNITRDYSLFTLPFDLMDPVTLFELPLELGRVVALFYLLFESDKFFTSLTDDLIPKPSTLQFSLSQGSKLYFFEEMCSPIGVIAFFLSKINCGWSMLIVW